MLFDVQVFEAMAVMNAGDVLWSWYLHGMAEGGKWSKTPTTTLISQPQRKELHKQMKGHYSVCE